MKLTTILSAAVFGAAAAAANAALIAPSVDSFSSQINQNPYFRLAASTADGSGLSGPGNAGDTHTTQGVNGASNGWLSTGTAFGGNDLDPKITYDLGGLFNLATTRIWNYNEAGGGTVNGSNSIRITFADTLANLATSTNTQTISVAQAGGTTTEAAQDFGTIYSNVRFVNFDIVSNHNGDDFDAETFGTGPRFAGLSEVRFEGTAVPEPCSAALLGLGGLALIMRRRK